jgi:hypothetical protein
MGLWCQFLYFYLDEEPGQVFDMPESNRGRDRKMDIGTFFNPPGVKSFLAI